MTIKKHELVLCTRNQGTPALGYDRGLYLGMISELNVRSIKLDEELPGVDWRAEAVFLAGRRAYGTGWGDTSGVYRLTDEDVTILRDLNREGLESREQAQYALHALALVDAAAFTADQRCPGCECGLSDCECWNGGPTC